MCCTEEMTTMEKTEPSETERNVSVQRDEQSVSLEVQALRSQGLSFKEIADKLGMSKSKVFRLLNGTVPHQKETVPEPSELDVGPLSNEPAELMSDTELSIEEKRLKREMSIKRLRARNAWLDHVTRHPETYYSGWNGGNDGHGGRENETIKDLKQEVRDLKQSVQNNPLGYMKLGVDAFKSGVDAIPKSPGVDPTAFMNTYRAGMQDARENLQAVSQSQAANVFNVKMKEMDGLEKLENKKIDFEVLKWQEGRESEKQLYSLIGQITGADGIVGKLAQTIGEGAKTRLERGSQKPSPQVVEIPCPNCQNKFVAIKDSPTVICPTCKSILGLQSQPQAQAPEQPKEPQPEQAPQSEAETTQEKPIDETPSVEVK